MCRLLPKCLYIGFHGCQRRIYHYSFIKIDKCNTVDQKKSFYPIQNIFYVSTKTKRKFLKLQCLHSTNGRYIGSALILEMCCPLQSIPMYKYALISNLLHNSVAPGARASRSARESGVFKTVPLKKYASYRQTLLLTYSMSM